MKKYFIVILFCFVGACKFRSTDKLCQDKQMIVSRYGDGQVSEIVNVNCIDTTLKMTIRFYTNGDTQQIYTMRNGKIDGMLKQFTKKKELELVSFYKEGSIDSIWTSFDKHGHRMSIQYFTYFPSQSIDIEFDTIGRIKNYIYVKDKKNSMIAWYLPNGEIDTIVGSYLINVLGDKPAYNTGDSLHLYFYVATPLNDSIQLFVSIHDAAQNDLVQSQELTIVNSKATLSSKINKRGNYEIKFDLSAVHKKAFAKPIYEHGTLHFSVK